MAGDGVGKLGAEFGSNVLAIAAVCYLCRESAWFLSSIVLLTGMLCARCCACRSSQSMVWRHPHHHSPKVPHLAGVGRMFGAEDSHSSTWEQAAVAPVTVLGPLRQLLIGREGSCTAQHSARQGLQSEPLAHACGIHHLPMH